MNHLTAKIIQETNPGKELVINWFYPRSKSHMKAVALMIHGLNLNPMRMREIVHALNGMNIGVYLLSLSGHGEAYQKRAGVKSYQARTETFKQVDYDLWSRETYQAYQFAREQTRQKKVPLVFVGYSLGGLLGCDLLISRKEVEYERMVLFAPALTIHLITLPLKLMRPFKRIIIPSMSPTYYRSNPGTPLAAYIALLGALKHFHRHCNDKLNIPTVVFIDKQDELVSYSKLKKLIARRNLESWQLYRIKKNLLQSVVEYNHLMIDEKSVGELQWERVLQRMHEHLR